MKSSNTWMTETYWSPQSNPRKLSQMFGPMMMFHASRHGDKEEEVRPERTQRLYLEKRQADNHNNLQGDQYINIYQRSANLSTAAGRNSLEQPPGHAKYNTQRRNGCENPMVNKDHIHICVGVDDLQKMESVVPRGCPSPIAKEEPHSHVRHMPACLCYLQDGLNNWIIILTAWTTTLWTTAAPVGQSTTWCGIVEQLFRSKITDQQLTDSDPVQHQHRPNFPTVPGSQVSWSWQMR